MKLPEPPFMEIRTNVLRASLYIETDTSFILSHILEIPLDQSIILGNTSNAISALQKVNLLLDTEILDKEQKESLRTFMELRNQLVHNGRFNTLVELFDGKSLSPKKNHLLRTYKSEGTEEQQLENAIIKLSEECVLIIAKARKPTTELVQQRAKTKLLANSYDVYRESLGEAIGQLDQQLNELEKQGKDVSVFRGMLVGLINDASKRFAEKLTEQVKDPAKYYPRSFPSPATDPPTAQDHPPA